MKLCRRIALLAGLIGLLWVIGPGLAHACPVCFQAKSEDSRIAFLITTIAMTGLPLLLGGALVFWVRRRLKQLAAEDQATATRRDPVGGEAALGTPQT